MPRQGSSFPTALGHTERKGSLVPKGVAATCLLTAIVSPTPNLVKHKLLSIAVVWGGEGKGTGQPTPLNFPSIY